MQTHVKHLSETKVQVTISLGASELADAEQVALARLAKTTKVDGFRKGKVPTSVLAKHVNPQTLQEQLIDTAISKAVATAFLDESIQALGRPAVEVKKFVPGEVLEFEAEADVLPKITLGDYKKLTAKPEKIAVKPEEVEEIIERVRLGFAEKKSVDRKAQDGDEVLIDFVGKKDGVAFDGGTATDHTLKLGSGQFIPGFEEGIVGHKAGEVIDLELPFPDDYHASDLAGQKVVFTVTIKSVQESSLPELTDELAKKAGPFETVEQLRDDITREITAGKEREAGEKLKDALIDELVQKSNVTAPEALVNDQMHSIEQDFSQNLLYRGLTLESYLRTNNFKDEDDWREKEVKPSAERRVKAGLVLNELVRAEKITATDEEIEGHIAMYKAQYGNNPEVLKQFESEDVRRDISNRYMMEKTVERLVELNSKK